MIFSHFCDGMEFSWNNFKIFTFLYRLKIKNLIFPSKPSKVFLKCVGVSKMCVDLKNIKVQKESS